MASAVVAPGAVSRRVGGLVLVGALSVAAGVLLPLTPVYVSPALDDSFAATLHFAAATRAAGTRVISTFGPLGFAFHDFYYPATYASMFALQLGLAAILCWALGWIGWAMLGSIWGAVLTIGACIPFLGSPDVRVLILPLLAVLIEMPRAAGAPATLRLAVGVAVGVVGLIKVTCLVAALVVLAPLTLVDVLGRRAPLTTIGAGATVGLLWWAMGLGWVDAVSYIDWSLREITPGYASAMQLPTSLALLAHVALVSAATLAVGTALARRRWPRLWPAPALALAAMLYLLFKAGFVRADVHVFITSFALLVIGVLIAVLVARTPRRLALALVLVAALPGALLWHAVGVQGPPTTVFRAVFPLEALRRLGVLPDVLWSGRNPHLLGAYAELTKSMNALPALTGPVDVYTYRQGSALAHGLDFRPRPVFQSYMAYTPRLARVNADFLRGARAPEWILFEPATIDRRLPALDDGLSWPLLLTHYRLAGWFNWFALLHRRPVPLRWSLTPLGRVETSTGAPLAVPGTSRELVWVRIDVQQTIRDRIVETLLAAPVVYLHMTLGDGRQSSYSVVPALAREGFLLSPLVVDTAEFAQLLQADPSRRLVHVSAISVTLDRAHGIDPGPRALAVEFFRLQIEGEPAVQAAGQ
jgi:hypothetical protein